jgi:hypothetical protein
MQAIDKTKQAEKSATQNGLAQANRRGISKPQEWGMRTAALAASLLLAAGCAHNQPAPPPPPPQAELDNARQPPPKPPASDQVNAGPQGHADHHKHHQPDNTAQNARDSGGGTLTPTDQGSSHKDRELTAAIRRAVVKDKSLSSDAHNAKIITRNSVVTLRGPVENHSEKYKLQVIAEKQAGVKQVNNQLETKTP